MIKITEIATEKSTIVFEASFTDEDDNAVVPSSITWSLVDRFASVIN